MKRFYNFLSLLLLSLVGVTTAVAQDYKRGELYTEVSDFEGKTVVLYAPGTSGDHPAGYMNGKNTLSTQITDSCFYVFEAIDGKTVDGEQLYRLKQVSSGLYVKDADGQEEDAFELTASEAEAFEMTVMPFDPIDAGDMPTRNSASDQKQDLNEMGFVLCRGEQAAEPFKDDNGNVYNEGYIYIGGVDVPFISPYTDTNVWCVYAYENNKGLEKLEAYLEMYCASGVEPYPAGTQPGYYKQDLVDAAKALFDKANLVYNEELSMSDEEIDVLCAQLKEAFEKLANEGYIDFEEGYFFIADTRANPLYVTVYTSGDTNYFGFVRNYTVPTPLDATAARHVWRLEKGSEEGKWKLKHVATGLYLTNQQAGARNWFLMGSINEATDIVMSKSTHVPGAWMFQYPGQGGNYYATDVNAGGDMAGCNQWSDKNDNGIIFTFASVSEAEFEEALKAAQQEILNEKLSALYDKALTNIMEGTAYKWDGEKDADFSREGALVSPTGDEATSHVFSRAQETDPNEGSTHEALLDNNVSTYYHSSWSSGAFTPSINKFHDVCFELDEPASGIVTAKICKRLTGNDYPTKFAIFGTNEADKANPDAADWKLEGIASINWDTPLLVDGEESEREKYVGYASFNLSQEYKYIRCAAIATIFNESNPMTNRGYFAISEMNLWKGGVLDEVNSTISMVSKPTMDRLNAALETAKAELAKGAATDATMAELQAAYEQFVKEFPVPALLTEAAAAAQAVADNAHNNNLVGDEVAQYPQAAYNALVAAIEAANNYDTKGKTAAEINAQVDLVNAAVAAFKASVTLPKAGKYYVWRGVGTKYNNGKEENGWNSLGALVYSPNNALNTSLYFTRPQGAAENLPFEELTDTVDALVNMKYLWYVEKAEAGKMVIRNVATGMYVGKKDDAVAQSKTPVEINMVAVQPSVFLLECGDGVQFNAYGDGQVGAWPDATDQNARWRFENVDESMLGSSTSLYWPVAAGKYQILTLPVSINQSIEGTIYDVIGVTADNKLALVEQSDVVPAGTPFIYLPDAELTYPAYGAWFDIYFEDDLTLDQGGHLTYATEPVATACLTGTLCEPDTVPAGYGYFYSGKPSATDNTVIGVNSGWIGVRGATMPVADEAEADATIELGKVVIDEITSAQVVTLPAAVSVYNVNGQMVRKNVKTANALKGLPAGIYVVGGQKFIVK